MAIDFDAVTNDIEATIKIQTTDYKADQLAVAILFKVYEELALCEGYFDAATNAITKKEY